MGLARRCLCACRWSAGASLPATARRRGLPGNPGKPSRLALQAWGLASRGAPGVFVVFHMTPEADRNLADSILHSDVVITWASTMIIDAAAFDKPIVLVGFDASPRPLSRSIRQYYRYDHHRAILASGGVRLVESPEERAEVVRGYLEYPERDRESREWIRREYAGELDGKAGERLAACLLGILDQDRA